jgi:hypothetical protein
MEQCLFFNFKNRVASAAEIPSKRVLVTMSCLMIECYDGGYKVHQMIYTSLVALYIYIYI